MVLRHRVVVALLLAAGLGAIIDAEGQEVRGRIVGVARDATGAALAGASITLSGPALIGGDQTVISDERGEYRFFDLPPGTYALSGTLSGFSPLRRPDIRLLAGTTLTIDLNMQVASTAEQVTVSGDAPVVDVTTTASGVKIDGAMLQELPLLQNKREGADIINGLPGVNSRAAFGGARDANLMLMDGAVSTVPNFGGTNGIVVNPTWMEEVQVVGLGASAEYGDFTGAFVHMVSRSGGNKMHGIGEYNRQPGGWQSDNTGSLDPSLQNRFKPVETFAHWDGGAQMGGPIMKDRLFYFGGFQYYKFDELPFGTTGVSHSIDKGPRGLAKLTWAATSRIKLEGTVRLSDRLSRAVGSATARPETATHTEEPIRLGTLRATWTLTNRTLIEARGSGFWYQQSILPEPPNTIDGPAPHTDSVTGVASVNAATYRDIKGVRAAAGVSLTRWAQLFGRPHEFKAGADFQRLTYDSLNGVPGGMVFQDANGQPNQVMLWAGDTTSGTGKEVSLFVQDSWELVKRLRVEPGLRATFNRGSVPVRGTVFKTNPLSPRFGVAWDVLPDHKTVVRGHYGRYHDPVVVTLFDYMDVSGSTPRITARVLGPNQFEEINRFTPTAANLTIDPNLEQSYVNQYLVGVERQLFGNFSLTAQYIGRRFEKIFAFKDLVSIYEPTQVLDPGPDGRAATADDGAMITAYRLTNAGQSRLQLTNPGAYRKYDAFQLIGQKRFSDNWQVLASYTYSKARGNVNNDILEEYAGGLDTGRTGAFVNPNNAINKTGPNGLDFPHLFSARGSYRLPWLGGFNSSAIYTYASGAAYGRRATIRLPQGNETIQIETRGTRRLDAKNQLDLRLQKTVPVMGIQASIYVDAFNVSNQGVIERNRVVDTSGATFGTPLTWSTPRTYQIGLRVEF